MTHPAVEDAAVVGQPCDADGERPLAFVVLSPDSGHITTDELISFTNGTSIVLCRSFIFETLTTNIF